MLGVPKPVEICYPPPKKKKTPLNIDLSFATSQPEFLRTQVGKLWKAKNANQKQIATVCNNVTQIFKYCVNFVKNKQLIIGGILIN